MEINISRSTPSLMRGRPCMKHSCTCLLLVLACSWHEKLIVSDMWRFRASTSLPARRKQIELWKRDAGCELLPTRPFIPHRGLQCLREAATPQDSSLENKVESSLLWGTWFYQVLPFSLAKMLSEQCCPDMSVPLIRNKKKCHSFE